MFLVGRVLVWTGGTIALVAFPLAMWQATGEARWTAALTAVETAPYLLLGLPAGALADRLPRRSVMGWSGIAAAVPVALLAWQGSPGPVALIVVSVASSSFFVLADAAGFGLLPELVERERIADAVARSTAASTIVTVAGPAVAGVLLAAAGVRWALVVDAAAVVAGSALLLALPRGRTADDLAGRHAGTRELVLEGLRFIRGHHLVRTLTLVGIGNSLAGGVLLGLLVPVVSGRHGGDGSGAVGLAYSALGVGTFLSTLLLPWVSKRVQPGLVTLVGLTGVAAGIVLWALVPGPVAGLVVLVAYQLAASTVILNGITIRHLATPENMQARVNTTARMIAWGGQPVGAAVAGALVDPLGQRTMLLLAAGTVVLTVGLAWRSPLLEAGRRLHETS